MINYLPYLGVAMLLDNEYSSRLYTLSGYTGQAYDSTLLLVTQFIFPAYRWAALSPKSALKCPPLNEWRPRAHLSLRDFLRGGRRLKSHLLLRGGEGEGTRLPSLALFAFNAPQYPSIVSAPITSLHFIRI